MRPPRPTPTCRCSPRRGIAALFLALATLASTAATAQASPWSEAELRVIASLRLSQLGPPPADPGNRVARDPAAAALGKELFFDERLSRNGQVSCATCHAPTHHFQDGRPRGIALGVTPRRTQALTGVAHNAWFFWDGRRDSLWAQAPTPLEDAREHGLTRTRLVHLLAEHHRGDYEAVFGALPDRATLATLPADAGPLGTASERIAWRGLTKVQQDMVSRHFAQAGKAIAAYVTTLRHAPSRFDRYAEAQVRGLRRAPLDAEFTRDEEAGLRLFIGKAQCIQCHTGPLFTDQAFHSTRVPPAEPGRPDLGRYLGADEALADEFNCLGRFSDAPPTACVELRFVVNADPLLKRAFKTPGLRGAASRPPYMHAGQFATLEAVIAHYVAAPEADPTFVRGTHQHNLGSELLPLALSARESAQLAAFLRTLDGPAVEVPATPP